MRVEWSPDPEKMLNGQSPLPIGVPCAGWSACGTRLLRREAGLSDVGSIPGSLGIQPGEGLAASGRRKARAAYMLMAQRGEAICHVMRQMKRVSRQKTRSAKSQSVGWTCDLLPSDGVWRGKRKSGFTVGRPGRNHLHQ
nr:uncharacterized protein LOC116154824 isoform X8 [Camelus dromedarius]